MLSIFQRKLLNETYCYSGTFLRRTLMGSTCEWWHRRTNSRRVNRNFLVWKKKYKYNLTGKYRCLLWNEIWWNYRLSRQIALERLMDGTIKFAVCKTCFQMATWNFGEKRRALILPTLCHFTIHRISPHLYEHQTNVRRKNHTCAHKTSSNTCQHTHKIGLRLTVNNGA